MIIQRKYEYIPACDGCGAELEPEFGYYEAVSSMKMDGWAFVKPDKRSPEWFNFCPKCKERRDGK